MAKKVGGQHPFGDLLGLRIESAADGGCRAHLEISETLFNPHQVVHGGVLFALADTSMGAALYSVMDDQESCATIEVKMNFIKAVREGRLDCETTVLRRGRSTAVLESKITANGELAAIALGTYAIFPLRPPGKAT